MTDLRTVTLPRDEWLRLAGLLDEHLFRALAAFPAVENELARQFAAAIGGIHAACGIDVWEPRADRPPLHARIAALLIHEATRAAQGIGR